MTVSALKDSPQLGRPAGMPGQAEFLLDVGARLAEGPVWDDRTQRLLWVDIEGRRLHWYDPATREDRSLVMPSRIGMVCLTNSGEPMVALEKGVYLVKSDDSLRLFCGDMEPELERNRLNDGKCDAAGRLWVGSMNMDVVSNQASLYCITPDTQCAQALEGVTVSNGIGWSADGRFMYYIDTPSGFLWRFDFDLETGRIRNRVPLIDYRNEEGNFDGMTIDAEGCLWIAHWGGFQVSRWDPANGKKMLSVKVPVPNPSSCTFGGPNLDILYITTATGRDKAVKRDYPLSGSLYVYRDGTRGLPACRFGK
jgi:sugar lactone lactonase YvrE